VDEGPIPAVHGVVRWRACNLIMRLHEEFGISVPQPSLRQDEQEKSAAYHRRMDLLLPL